MPNRLVRLAETSVWALRGGVISGFTFAVLVGSPVTPVSSHGTPGPGYPSVQSVRSCGRRCGVERWQIKTLSDLEADRVDFTPVPTTVEALGALPRPARTPQLSRISPVEFTTYQIDAYLGGFRHESDGDVHLILFGMKNQRESMIVEIPDPNCSGACASGLSADFAKARAMLDQILAEPNPTDQPIVVRVTGVGFFDRNHRQIGAAPNIIELHPVLTLERVRAPSLPNQFR
jgi:hypothetical protein